MWIFAFNTESPEEVPQGEAPPTEESTVHTDADSQSQPTEETSTGWCASSVAVNTRELKEVN